MNLRGQYIEISSEEEMEKASKWLESLGYKNLHDKKYDTNGTYLFISGDTMFHFNNESKNSYWKPFSILYDEGMPRDVVRDKTGHITTNEEDLLAKAKRLYPIGTKYKCAAGSYNVFTVESMDWAPSPSGHIYGEDGKGCIYKLGKWAEIVHVVKPIEKWSVGTYVVFFNNSTNHGVKLGTIDKIKYNIDKVGDAWFEYYGCCGRSRLDVDVKWFATLEEAEAYSKSLNQSTEWKPKVGEWVTLLTSYGSLSKGSTYQILEKQSSENDCWVLNHSYGEESYLAPYDYMFRKATQEEIDSVQQPHLELLGVDKSQSIKSFAAMSKDELLEYAKKKYPVGTRYKTVGYSETEFVVEKQTFEYDGNIRGEDGKGILYKDGKWAEIIEPPKAEEYNRGNIGSNISSITYSYTGPTASPKETHQSINIEGKKFSPIKAELIKVKQLKIN